MEFCIAVSFTERLARLTSEERKQVKLTVFNLQQDPFNPGHRGEPMHSFSHDLLKYA